MENISKDENSLQFQENELIAVKIRGLPFHSTYQEVSDFFVAHEPIAQSVVLGINNEGRRSGYGSILFATEEKADMAAKEMNQQFIGNRYVELSVISFEDYRNFNNHLGKGTGQKKTVEVKLYNLIN